MRLLMVCLVSASLLACGSSTSDFPAFDSGNAGDDTDGDTASETESNYEDLGDGVVRDLLTGFEWEQKASDIKRNLEDSESHCNALALGGHNDWIFPDWRAYRSICVQTTGPAQDCAWPDELEGPCPVGERNTYWSHTARDSRGATWRVSVSFARDDQLSCYLHYHDELNGAGPINTDPEELRYVRCQRVGTLDP